MSLVLIYSLFPFTLSFSLLFHLSTLIIASVLEVSLQCHQNADEIQEKRVGILHTSVCDLLHLLFPLPSLFFAFLSLSFDKQKKSMSWTKN